MISNQLDLSTFKKMQESLVSKNEESWQASKWGISSNTKATRDYSFEEIEQIINSSSLTSMQDLSRNYFNRRGLYKRIIYYYATLLTYAGLLIPHVGYGHQLSSPHIAKKYYAALNYVDKLNIAELFTRISIRALIDGCYYGVISHMDKTSLTLFDLPVSYCRSRYRDLQGNDIIEFNVQYFDRITDEQMRKEALNSYPNDISRFYTKYHNGKTSTSWITLPAETGVCFPFFDDGRPLFLDTIPEIIKYGDTVDIEQERALEEIRKIIVQKIPHLNDGTLLFEPEEAVEMHNGAVGMMKGNKNVSVLTSYADIDSIVSKTTNENLSSSLEKMLQNMYAGAGVSAQLFAPTGSQALPISIQNDMSLMMVLGNKYSRFITNILNSQFANSNITFAYKILPLSEYNKSDFITDTLKLAQAGYSFLLPAIGSGISQHELMSVKSLENDLLNLKETLIPLSTSYTETSDNEGGAPTKEIGDRTEKTIKNEEKIKDGGSNG